MDDAGLDDRFREHGGNGFRKALRPVDRSDEGVGDTAVFNAVITRIQNLAPSVCSIQMPRTSLAPVGWR